MGKILRFVDLTFLVNSRASTNDDAFFFDNGNLYSQSVNAQPWLSFHEDGSFKDALLEDLPIAKSPTLEDARNAVDWSSIAFSERTGYENEDRGFFISNEQAGSGVTVLEKDAFFGTENDALTANSNLMRVPSNKPPPKLLESQSSSWASSSSSGSQKLKFLAAGGGRGVYRALTREIFHVRNPAALELRPRPLKLQEVNQSIRTIMCTYTSIWAAFDHGLKV